jgi:hypothetical protein
MLLLLIAFYKTNEAAYLMEVIAGLLSRAVLECEWTQRTVWTQTNLTERRWNSDGTETWRIMWISPHEWFPADTLRAHRCVVVGLHRQWHCSADRRRSAISEEGPSGDTVVRQSILLCYQLQVYIYFARRNVFCVIENINTCDWYTNGDGPHKDYLCSSSAYPPLHEPEKENLQLATCCVWLKMLICICDWYNNGDVSYKHISINPPLKTV